MNAWKLIKSLNKTQLKSLFFMFLRRPHYIYPTFRATSACYRICGKNFPGKHQLNGPENAFRHALWNILIAKATMKWIWIGNKAEKSERWAEKITDWHEEFAPNSDLAKAMDLHNNRIGRELFLKWLNENKGLSNTFIVDELKEMLPQSRKITSVGDIEKQTQHLIHI